jgi:hypothetical protein
MPSLIEMGQLVLEKKIFFIINICKSSFPYCRPSRPPETMMWTISEFGISIAWRIMGKVNRSIGIDSKKIWSLFLLEIVFECDKIQHA